MQLESTNGSCKVRWNRSIAACILATALGVPLVALAGGAQVERETRKQPAVIARQRGKGTTPAAAMRRRFLEMWGRGYFPGRSGQLMIVAREGDILTRRDPEVPYMHGSPWPYDTAIPLLFHGRNVRPGTYRETVRQQDVSPTIAAVLRTRMPASATGRALARIVREDVAPPRVVLLAVMDGMRLDYLNRYAHLMPTLTRLRTGGAWFTTARIDYLPTNTGVGHSTIATGTDPRFHGITGNNLYDRVARARQDLYAGWSPRDLMALTLSDVWSAQTDGRAVIVVQGSSVPPATALAGHGACLVSGRRVLMAGYDQTTGRWGTNNDCYTLPSYLAGADARSLWPADGLWLGHEIDSPARVRRSGLFPAFEGNALVATIEREPLGADDVPDLVLANFKGADFVGHKHGPDSVELRTTLAEVDRQLAHVLTALERKAGDRLLVALLADHGMPSEPASPDRRRFAEEIVAALHERFDPQDRKLITYYEPENGQLMVDPDQLSARGLTLPALARFLESQPYIFAAFTEDEVRRTAVR